MDVLGCRAAVGALVGWEYRISPVVLGGLAWVQRGNHRVIKGGKHLQDPQIPHGTTVFSTKPYSQVLHPHFQV